MISILLKGKLDHLVHIQLMEVFITINSITNSCYELLHKIIEEPIFLCHDLLPEIFPHLLNFLSLSCFGVLISGLDCLWHIYIQCSLSLKYPPLASYSSPCLWCVLLWLFFSDKICPVQCLLLYISC